MEETEQAPLMRERVSINSQDLPENEITSRCDNINKIKFSLFQDKDAPSQIIHEISKMENPILAVEKYIEKLIR